MQYHIKIIITAIIALAIGLGGGYLIFGNKGIEETSTAVHQHEMGANQESDENEIWTCSMHPQIRQNEPGDCAICGMDLIPLAGNTSDDPLVLQMTDDAVKLANIQTTIVGASNQVDDVLRLSGKVQSDERLASSQVAHVPGRIEKLFVTFTGAEVNQGQKLATIYSPELITAQQELLEALKLKEINPGLVEAARNKLRYWKIGESAIEAIEEKGSIQETFTLYADAAGIVTNKRIAVGDYVKKGEALFDLMNLRKVWVLFDAYEEDLADISIGNSIEFTTPAIANKTFKTNVTFIDPLINPNTRVAAIRTEVNNTNGLLKPEMFVTGFLQKKSKKKSLLMVPKSAVLWTGTRSVVYVKIPEMNIPSFKFREIEIGAAAGQNYQVLNGLEPGEEIVTYGSFSIDAAAQLNNQTSMMNREVKIKSNGQPMHLPDYTASTPIDFKEQLAELSDAYLSLKDAMVATDQTKATNTSLQMIAALTKVDMSLLKGDAHLYWMEQLAAMDAHGTKISRLKDIEEQRKQFYFFSEALIKAIKAFGIPEDTLYVQHCPMANADEGADWLSREAEIRNPYFGDKMLSCGFVKTTIDKGFKNPLPKLTENKNTSSGHNH